MEIHQLIYFVAVAETGSFSRAAERCNVAQPSLSQQIQKLEQELGEPLFDRLTRRVVLTDAGRNLLPRATTILAELQDIKHSMKQETDASNGTLNVGFIPTIAPFVLPQVIRHFSQDFPKARLSVHEDLTDALVRDLIDGKLDVGITSTPIHNRLIRTQELLSEPLLVASSKANDIITRANIHVKELDEFPFIALSEVHCLGEQVQSFCYQQNLEMKIVCHTAQLSTVQNCVAMGLGVSLVPKALAVSDQSKQVIYRELSGAAPQRKIAAATHIERTQSFLAKKFIEIVRAEYPA
ncbi:MAG: LysR family transcriptional regulator [Chloroflexota bacterium]|nr:LysR family transcriptional regulator [Chloroflexota bacterium]MBI5702428.1 LysR family transcriptional regulator [Chloroflexota bacterium]